MHHALPVGSGAGMMSSILHQGSLRHRQWFVLSSSVDTFWTLSWTSVWSSLLGRWRFFGGCELGKMHLIYQKMGFKVQELKKENFLMEWVNVYVLFKNKKSEIFCSCVSRIIQMKPKRWWSEVKICSPFILPALISPKGEGALSLI